MSDERTNQELARDALRPDVMCPTCRATGEVCVIEAGGMWFPCPTCGGKGFVADEGKP